MATMQSPHQYRVATTLSRFLLVALVACSSQPAVVSKPPEDMGEARLDEPWLMDERAMMRNQGAHVSGLDSHNDEDFQGPLEDAPQSTLLEDVADIIAFPFRGIGWLLQVVF